LNSRVEKLAFGQHEFEVRVKKEDQSETIRTKMVIDAEGISSRLAKEMGLPGPDRKMLAIGVEAEVGNVENRNLDSVDVYFGSEYAPGFYGWLIPINEGKAKVGLAVKVGNPKIFLEKLMKKHPAASERLRNARIARVAVHPITLGGPASPSYSDRFLAVGDAASHVKSTTGGGVILGMTCAAIAAQISSEAVEKMDFSSEFLSSYQKRVNSAIGFDAETMVRIRKTLNAITDQRLDRLIRMCARLGLEKTLKNVNDIDFQGQSLLHLLLSPRMLTIVSYFLFEYLARNP
jgi:flavin-dependent dehydrogenase